MFGKDAQRLFRGAVTTQIGGLVSIFSYEQPKRSLLAENCSSIEDGDSHVQKKGTWSAMDTRDFTTRKASSYCKSIKIQGNLPDL